MTTQDSMRKPQSQATSLATTPTEAECWAEFWDKVAIIWASASPKIQQAFLTKVTAEDRAALEASLARHTAI